MESLSTILGLLKDGKWHKTSEIDNKIPISKEEFQIATFFLKEMEALEIEEEKLQIKITKLGKEILKLPDEK